MTDLGVTLQATLGDGFRLERELGGGGMSRVFLAEETRFHRRVVIKVLAPELAAGVSAERFEREITLAAGLQHAHVVPVIAAGDVDGLPWYSMPYVDGESLRARISRGLPTVPEAVAILRNVAQALAYAHGRGIVHRDIKPENVLLSGGAAVVADFGIAKALSASKTLAPGGTLTQVGTSLGSPAYMAPEQALGDEVDARADLYAWGVVAYELLSGRHPFAGRTTAQQLIAAHIAEVPQPLREVAPAVPAPLAALVMRVLEKNREKRPASAAELLAGLDAVVTAGVTGEVPAVRSRRVRVGAVAGLVALLLAGGGLAWQVHGGAPGSAGAPAADAGPLLVAVLPFEHAGPVEQAVFADGLTDAVAAKLAALPGLAVIDRRSAAQYRATSKPAKQIGTELGVRYLLEGVVRWARDAGGAWHGQVTPTLVDARTGTTRWTGTPAIVTPSDPFTAQATIATDVARALEVELRPVDEAALARRMTENPEAFAAYQRGLAIEEAAAAMPSSRYQQERAMAEYERAVTLDSTFADAWGRLARAHVSVAALSPGDRERQARMRAALVRARALAPDHPYVLLTRGYVQQAFDRDTVGVSALVRRALAVAPNDGLVLSWAAGYQRSRGQPDSAYALAHRAATLDPRSPGTVYDAGMQAAYLRRWDDARRHADGLIALDSTDERGWEVRVAVERLRGDTPALQRELARGLAHLPRPSARFLSQMAYAGEPYGSRYAALSAQELGIGTLADSVWNYYDNKADVFSRLGDGARARVYYDSMRTALTGRPLDGPLESFLLAIRALAEAALGDPATARRSLARADSLARPIAARDDLGDRIDPRLLAAIHARLGEPERAVRYLDALLAQPGSGYTAHALATEPKFLPLHGTPAFERFLRAHPE